MDNRQIGGWCLVAAGAATVFAMAHHPSGLRDGGASQAVHGALMAMTLLTAFGFLTFVANRGAGRAPIQAGTLAFAVALFANLGAASINGFAVPGLTKSGEPVGRDVILFAWQLNQALAGLAVYATGAAFLFWSIDLVRGSGLAARLVGLAGLPAALLPTMSLASGLLRMNVHGAFAIYSVQAIWGAMVGLLLLHEARRASAA